MLKHTLRSLFSLLFAALVGSIVIFVLVNMLGGDIVTVLLGKDAAPGDKAFMREAYGLDDPLVVQYLHWLRGAVTGDLGTSYGMRYDIVDEIQRRLQPTLLITIGALLVSAPLALVLGTFSAMNAKKVRGGVVDVFSQVGIAIPTFWAGLLLVLVFGVRLGWLPTGGYVPFGDDLVECIRSIILPILALSLGITSVFTRYVRSAMIDVMNEDFMRSAMARGRSRRGAALVHGVRNASIPLVTVGRVAVRPAARRSGRRRERVRPARHRQTDRDRDARTRGDRGPVACARDHARHLDPELRGRHRLRLPRPSHPGQGDHA